MSQEERRRKTLYEMIRDDEWTSLHTVFAHRDGSLGGSEAQFFYTISNLPSDQNYIELKVGDKTIQAPRRDHLEDLHLPDLSAADARVLMLSQSRKKQYSALKAIKR